MSNTVDPRSHREDVYAALDGEREYQDLRWNANNSSSAGKHSYEEWLVYMRDYMRDAEHLLARSGTPDTQEKVGHVMRKIVAMGVACMEQHGAQFRADEEIEALRPQLVAVGGNFSDEIPF